MSKDIPKIYVANIIIEASIPGRGKNTNSHKKTFNLDKYPALIFEDGIMEGEQKERLFKKIYKERIKTGDFKKIKFKIKSISDIKFLSEINYKYK
tara:strand:- start:3514 stop:3798 length:285 start_codon:yes stop_codon:yes gene_type:complete